MGAHTHAWGYGSLWVWVRVRIKIPMGYPYRSLFDILTFITITLILSTIALIIIIIITIKLHGDICPNFSFFRSLKLMRNTFHNKVEDVCEASGLISNAKKCINQHGKMFNHLVVV